MTTESVKQRPAEAGPGEERPSDEPGGEPAPSTARSSEGRRRWTPSGARLGLLVFAAVAAGAVWAIPRPVLPRSLPALVLPAEAAASLLAEDRAAAENTPTGEDIDALRALFLEQGRAEVGEGETAEAFQARGRTLLTNARAVRATHGEESLAALRSEAMVALRPAMDGELEQVEEEGRLGSFPRMLDRYGVTEDGEVVAPWLVVRALYLARWNAIHRLELTDGMSPPEAQAYWGWLALHAESAPMTQREQAAIRFRAAGGHAGNETVGVFAFRRGRPAQAADAFDAAYAATGSFRLRNHALAALSVAQ